MNNKSVYYSCATWLSLQVNRLYYGNVHYVWCAPYFDPRSPLNPHNVVPPTSSPKEIYWSLKKEVDEKDRHSAKIAQNKAGIRRGADINLKLGTIGADQHTEIMDIVGAAEISDFRPLLYIIPANPVESMLKRVPVKDRAALFSEEYIIESLPRTLFDAIEL